MYIVRKVIRIRGRRKSKFRKTHLRAGFSFTILISLLLAVVSLTIVIIFTLTTEDLPSLDLLPLLLEPPDGLLLQPTKFYDRSGQHIIHVVENPAVNERNYSYIEENSIGNTIPSTLVKATIVVSDPTFEKNPGFSLKGILNNTHNTLAQQLVSDLLLWDETPGYSRSLRERLLAWQLTQRYGKEKILEWYLNITDFGNLAFGVEAAARIYFGKSVENINLFEAAILAAISEQPELNPFDSPQIALARGKSVLDLLAQQNLITIDEADKAKSSEITFNQVSPTNYTFAPAFINLAWETLSKNIAPERINRGGFEIITTLDYDLQYQVSCTNEIHLERIKTEEEGSSTEETKLCLASQLLPTLSVTNEPSTLDQLSTNLMVLDPKTGQILSLVISNANINENNRIEAHSSGTLLTPIVYLTAFTRGYNPSSLVWDIPLDTTEMPIGPINLYHKYEGPIRLRQAFANDFLNPAFQLINNIGYENILKTANQLGINSSSLNEHSKSLPECRGCELILDGGNITLIEAVQAYGVFANEGLLVGNPFDSESTQKYPSLQPTTIIKVKDGTAGTWSSWYETETRPVISNQLAYLMTNVLSDEGARWQSMNHPNPLEIGRPAGAKIGTTPMGNDVWTVGFTPHLVVCVWSGIPESSQEQKLETKLSSALWHAIIQYASQKYPPDDWDRPPGVSLINVCDPSGMLPTLQCPNVVSEVFLAGQEPNQPDTLYETYQVNRETGRLATIFTPPELIEEQTYLNIPPEARNWAEATGLETPPEVYDELYIPSIDPNVRIDSPTMLSQVRGALKINGQASGPDFESYRLQVGEGINPSGWTIIKSEISQPVENGILGIWDTTGLNGLFAIQLITLRKNESVDTAMVQVIVDNLPPNLKIQYPENEQTFSYADNRYITFIIETDDNTGIESVEYYIDDSLVSNQQEPPYAFNWKCIMGTYEFTVKAKDTAGNISQESITITIER